jgi:hypothetical protein
MKPTRLAVRAILYCSAFLAILCFFACQPQVIIVITTQTPPPPTSTPTLLPYPDALDVAAVQQEVTWLINAVRIDQDHEPFQWDETLQELAEWQAWKIVLGEKPFDHIDNWPPTRLGETVAELRACMSNNSTTRPPTPCKTVETLQRFNP